MSTTVDNRVLEMRFDNRQFEQGVSTTMTTLDKLKQKLNLTGASKGLENLGKTAKNVDMSGLSKGVEIIQAKFSAMEVAGITALSNITNSAVNAGKRIANALTLEPIKTGFQEYETQMGAIQTILANTQSKGSTLQDVNAALDELNEYADKTIYNFTEMTKNIGTFTAAGVELEKSVTSIKGIANLAAVSGSTSQQASTAMYQLSQALAAGKVSLMDWNSVVNAGMGGEVFQNALKRTARQMGKNVDEAIEKYGSFRESLTQGEWLTTEVLTETLTQLSGAYTEADLIAQGYTESQAKEITKLAETAVSAATEVKTFTQLMDTVKEAVQSGWAQSWRTIIGDFGEAKDLFTNISNAMGEMIGKSADARNKLLTEGLATGWKQLVGQGISDEEGFKDTIKAVAKEHDIEIDDMINKTGSFEKSLKEGWLTGDILTESLGRLTEKVNGLSIEQLKEMGYTSEQVEKLNELNNAVKNGELSMDEFAKKMTMASGRENIISGLTNIFKTLGDAIKPIQEAFREIFPSLKGEQLYAFTEKFKNFTDKLEITADVANKIKRTFKGLFSVIDIGVEGVKALGKGFIDIVKHFDGIGGKALDAGEAVGDYLSNLRNSVVSGDLFGKAVDKITGFLGKAIERTKDFDKSIAEMVDASVVVEGFVGAFKGLWNIVKTVGGSVSNALRDVISIVIDAFSNGDIFDVINSGLFAGVLLSIKNFIKGITSQVEDVKFIDKVKEILDGVKDSLSAYQDNIKAEALMKIAGAVGILAASLYVISGIDSDKLGNSLGSIGILMGELIGAMAVMSKLNTGSLTPLNSIIGSLANISRMISMMGLGASVLILASAMRVISGLDWDQTAKGLTGIGGMVGILVAAARLMNTENKSITKFAGQMVILSAAIASLSGVAKILGSMKWEELAKGGTGILGIVTILVSAAKIMDSDYKSITKFSGQMMAMTLAIGALAGVGKLIATMSWEEMGKAGTGILGLVTMLVAVSKIMSSGKGDTAKFAGQMALMAIAINSLVPSFMLLGSMDFDSILQALISISGAMVALGVGLKVMNGSLPGAAALIVAATAIMMLTAPLKILGSMDLNSILQALITMAGTFVVLGVGGMALAPLIPAILGLAGAFALFGVATAGLGVGLSAIAAGFTVLATAGAAGATAFVASFGVIVTGVLGLIPQIAQIIGLGILEISRVIGDYAPQLAGSFLKLILGVLQSLDMYTPQIVGSLVNFFTGVLNSLADHVPSLLQAAMNFIRSLFQGIIDALGTVDTGNLLKGVLAVGIMTALMHALSGVVALIPSAMAGMLGVGAVIAEMSLVLAAVGALAQLPGLEWLIGEGGDLLQKIGSAIGQFVGGIVGGIAEGGSSALPQIATNLSKFMDNIQPFISGAKGIDPSVMEGVQALAKAIMMLTAADILDAITSFITGGNSIGEFAKQLVPLGEGMKEFGKTVDGIDVESISASANAAKALGEVVKAIPNDGGLWGLLAGDKDLGSLGTKLVPFGEGMKSYSSAVSGIDTDAIITSAQAAKAIVDVVEAIPNDGGLWGLLAGDKDLSIFGQKLIPFGEGMKLYSSAVAGLNSQSIIASVEATKALVEISNAIPSEGGFWQLITGDKDFASFGQKLIQFGQCMKSYADAVLGVDSSSVIMSAEAAQALISVTEAIPVEGGFWSLVDGNKDFSSFGEKLVSFGKGMKTYANAVSGIDTASIIASVSAATSMISVANVIPTEGGVWGWLTGEKDLGAFGNKLVPFGNGMKSYSESVSGINASAIVASVPAANAVIEIIKAIPNSLNIASNGDTLSSISSNLKLLGVGMSGYSGAISSINVESIISSVSAVKSLVSVINSMSEINSSGVSSFVIAINELGKAQLSNFISAFSGGVPQMTAVGSNLITGLISGINSKTGEIISTSNSQIQQILDAFDSKMGTFMSTGIELMTKLISGISSQSSTLTSTVSSTVSSAASAIEAQFYSFYSGGIYLGQGLVLGIESMKAAAYNAGFALGQEAARGEKDGQDSHSPSKLTIQSGKWLGEGLIIGIKQMMNKVYKSGYSLGDKATESVSCAVNELSGMLDPNLDSEPTISPVVDLGNMKTGLNAIDSIMSEYSTFGISTKVSAISRAMNRRNQNGSTEDVVVAINKLRKDLGSLDRNTYNINGITYDGNSGVSDAINLLIQAVRMEGRM